MADAVDGHLDTNGDLLVVRGEGRDPILLKSGRGGAHAKLVAANLGDHLVVRHGDHVDHHGECAQVATLAVGRRVARVRVGTEG